MKTIAQIASTECQARIWTDIHTAQKHSTEISKIAIQ